MLIRALIVLLIVLNLGAAAWWISRPAPPPPPAPAMAPDVARLQLLSEGAPAPVVAPVPVAAPTVTPPPVEPPATAAEQAPQCFSLGPFADAAAALAATARIGKQATRVQPREVAGKGASGYSVFLPPSADRAAAQALAQRIGAAGFNDYLVINTGDQANGIALGRYRSRESAESRQSALQAAGFAAQVQAIGEESAAQWWLDLAAAATVTGPQLQALSSAAQARALDCTTLR